MRSSLLIILVLAAQGRSALQAQDLMPLFEEPTRTWTSEASITIDWCHHEHVIWHWISGDSIIDGLTYHRINSYYSSYSYPVFPPGDCGPSMAGPGIERFVREESGKVFLRQVDQDVLIYDLTAEVGDTVPNVLVYGGVDLLQPPAIVIEVDSILIDGSYRKRQRLDALDESIYEESDVIEGIGNTGGLFNSLALHQGVSASYELVCVRENEQVIFGNENCVFFNSVSELSSSIQLTHPNPTNGIINFSDQVTYEIFDPTGRMIRSGRSNTTDLSSHPSGIYFIRTLYQGTWTHHQVMVL